MPENDYSVDQETGAWSSIPWPADPEAKRHLIENSIGPLVIRWAENRLTDEEFEQFGPGLTDPASGGPFHFTPDHQRLVILYYAHDGNGVWLFRDNLSVVEHGDDLLRAAVAAIEAIGPSRLVWDDVWGGWTGAPSRWRSLVSPEAGKWHGVTL
ncbi:hypothetical protein HGK72_30835 [Mycolicibacterium fortuitum]|uniref:hypothetical protein n=1 Tax=Mycolicibacterium fortuitum TaxID=1766 RepID=UPI00148FE3FE|nr:hypothetical protein [Mycolicibacterium fortuitum]